MQFLIKLGQAFLTLICVLFMICVSYKALHDARSIEQPAVTYVDMDTGCQYLITPQGGIAVRNGTDGFPICRDTVGVESAPQ